MSYIKIQLYTLLFVTSVNGQFYSETIRDQNRRPIPDDGLFLPAPPPKAPTLLSAPPGSQELTVQPTLSPIQDNASMANIDLVPNDWIYQPEPFVENLPPHLTRFLGMLIYYSNGSAYIVYTNENAIHHQKGLRTGDRILSINGKNVSFYKDRFIEQLNEIRPERDIHIHCISGNPSQQRILIIPNLYRKDDKLDQLCLKAGLGDMDMWFIANGNVPTLRQKPMISPPPPSPEEIPVKTVSRNYRKSRRQIFDPILKPTSNVATTQNKQLIDMFGMLLSYESGRLTVLKVRENSAADNAKIVIGDEITQINDLSTKQLAFQEIEQLSAMDSLILGWASIESGRSKIGNFHNHSKPTNR